MSLAGRHQKMQNFEPDKAGNYHYVGNWQILRSDAKQETRTVSILLALLIAGILAVGLIPGSVNHLWYVMGPYAFTFLTAGVSTYYCVSFMISHWVLMEQEHKRGIGTVSVLLLLTVFLMGFAAIGQIVSFFIISEHKLLPDILIAVTAWIACVAAAILRHRVKHRWHFELISEKERQEYVKSV